MPNSKNTTWVVCCVCWETKSGREPEIKHCYGRSYRNENYARDRYSCMVDDLIEKGFSIKKLKVPDREEYEGIRAHASSSVSGRDSDVYYVIYIDRNPVWHRD